MEQMFPSNIHKPKTIMCEYKISELKQLITELENLDVEEVKDVISKISEEETDFESGDYRFINSYHIDKIMTDELESDLYMLGCFNASFIADATGLPIEMIEACQKSDAYEAIGKGIVATCGVEKLADLYQQADGYSHHFAHYDGEQHEVDDYYVFRVS